MANYRIKVEPIGELNEDMMPDDDLRMGVECDGFTIIADRYEEHGTVYVEHMSIIDIATTIASDAFMLKAAYIAKAMWESVELTEKRDNPFLKFLEAISKG